MTQCAHGRIAVNHRYQAPPPHLPTPPPYTHLKNISLSCNQASNSSTSYLSFVGPPVAINVTVALYVDSWRRLYMKMSPHMSFTSPKVCTAMKPQFNFIYNSSEVSPICSMTTPCQLLTETLQKLHSPFSMKMPPENIAIFNHNATVAPSAEPPRIPSDTPAALNVTDRYEDPWTVVMVHTEATKFNMLSISRHHRPGHWMAPLLHQRRSRCHHLSLLHYRRPEHQAPWMCTSLKQN